MDSKDEKLSGLPTQLLAGLAAAKERVNSATVADFRKRVPRIETFTAPPVEYVIEGVIPARSVGLISGESGVGKTTVTTSMLIAISQGLDWCGRKTVRTPVIVLDRENGVATTKKRLFVHGMGLDGDGSNIYWCGGWLPGEPIKISDESLKEVISAFDPKPLVFADSFIAHHEGSENDADKVRKTLQLGRDLADMGATVIYIHHTGKDGANDYRGSGDIKGAVDFAYKVEAPGRDKGKLTKITMKQFKWRDEIEDEIKLKVVPPGKLIAAVVDEAVKAKGFKAPEHFAGMTLALQSYGAEGVTTGKFEAEVDRRFGVDARQTRNWVKIEHEAGKIAVRIVRKSKFLSWVVPESSPQGTEGETSRTAS